MEINTEFSKKAQKSILKLVIQFDNQSFQYGGNINVELAVFHLENCYLAAKSRKP
jgi:hypothetical protein